MTWTPTSQFVPAAEPSIPAPKPKRYTITLEETGEVREARNYDWFRFDGGAIDVWHDAEPSVNEYPILRVVSREAK